MTNIMQKISTGKYIAILAGASALGVLLFFSTVFAVGINGSFETGTDPGSFATLNAGDTNITDWTVNSGSVDYIGSYWQASDGVRSVDLNGLEAGSISQTFSTVVGATYDVAFDLSGSPDGRPVEDLLYSPSAKEVSVSANGALSQSFFYDTSVQGNSLADMKWASSTYSFVATTTSTTLRFASQIAGAFGPALDNVSITETLPPPAACENPVTQTFVSDTTNNTVATGGSPAVSVTPHPAWTAVIPGSTTWIWETGPTSVDEVVTFERSFTATGTVLSATLDIATDNSYKVFIDGVEVAADASATNFTLATQDTYDLMTDVTPGTHTLRIEVKNHGTYNASSNPAGLLYKFEIETCPPPTPPAPPANACATPAVAPAGFTLQNGTSGNDTVTLAPSTMFVGMGGNDKVSAPPGDYIICLRNGNDKVKLSNGNYTIDAGGGNNKIATGNGNGTIVAASGNDKITTGNGDHTITAGGGNNKIVTGDGTQNVTTGSGNDKITTGSGDDTINAGGGNNKVATDGGDDSITTGSGNDNVNGGAGTDTCSAGGGSNTVINCEL